MARRKGINSRRLREKNRKMRVMKMRRTMLIGGAFLSIIAVSVGIMNSGILHPRKIATAMKSSGLFVVKKIAVKGNDRIPIGAILGACGIDSGSGMYDVNPSAVAASLCENPWIRGVHCIKKWWGTVVIEIRERHPMAFVLLSSGEVALFDAYGVVLPLEKNRTYNLPLVTGADMVKSDKGTWHIDSSDLARVKRFIETARLADPSLFTLMTQIDISDKLVAQASMVTPPTVIEIGYDADTTQVKNIRYLLKTLASRNAIPERINLKYRNLAYVKENQDRRKIYAD